MEARASTKEFVPLVLPGNLGPDCLQDEWDVEIHQKQSRLLTFWDSFEWGLWFGGHLLYSCGDRYHLATRKGGWPGPVLYEEKAESRLRFWGDVKTAPMRALLKGMLGLRGLAVVAEGTFSLCQSDLRNDLGKIVCRLAWSSVATGKRGDELLLQSCQIVPLLGYEAEAERVAEQLNRLGAQQSAEGPLNLLLRQANRVPQKYSLRPCFGLKPETAAREAAGRIIRPMLAIAVRNLPGILDDLDTEFLHDYRICLRKIRSVLSLVKGIYPAATTERMRALLGDLARQTNRLRDLDVYLLAREEYLALLPPLFRPSLERMFDDFSAERKREVRRTISKLRASSHQRCFQELESCFAEQTEHEPSPAADLPVGPLVFSQIYKRYRKIRRIAAEIKTDTPDEVLHQLRIEGKKLRYMMEFFSELIPAGESAEMQKQLRRLQGRLGEFNDASVQQKSLLAYWEQHKDKTDCAPGLGGLVSILYQRQQQTRTTIQQSLEEFCGGPTAAAFKRVFRLPASVPATNAPQVCLP